MAKRGGSGVFTIICPCCQGELVIDPEVKAVIRHKAAEKPKTIESFDAALTLAKGEAERREEAFRRSLAAHKDHKSVLDRKFEELLRQAKENPDEAPPPRPIDID